MGKITVKRFLQKRLKPIEVYSDLNELGYYLYYSITYNRKTQHIRSLTGAVMTEKAFNHLEQTNEPLNYETNYKPSEFHNLKLNKELEYIYNAVNYIVNSSEDEDINIFDDFFIPTLKEYFQSLKDCLFFIGWLKPFVNIYTSKDKEFKESEKRFNKEYNRIKKELSSFKNPISEAENIFYLFNKEYNLLLSIKQIEKILKIDIKKYFHSDTLKLWYVIDLVLKYHNKKTNDKPMKIDFILNFDEIAYINENKNYNYPLSDEEIKILSNLLKKKALIF